LITSGTPYHTAWQQYRNDGDLPTLIAAVARIYATDPGYARQTAAIDSQENVAAAIAEAWWEVAA